MTVDSFNTHIGELLLIAQAETLVYCNWKHPDCERKYSMIVEKFKYYPSLLQEKKVIEDVKNQLEDYFSGCLTEFSVPLECFGTSFQKEVWKVIAHIPYGFTLTYKSLALSIGQEKGVRAVAQACGANPLAIIVPCHRVVASDGSLGGYTGGVEIKKQLLELEKKKYLSK